MRRRTSIMSLLCAVAVVMPICGCAATPHDYSVSDTLGTNARSGMVLLRNVRLEYPAGGRYHIGEDATVHLTVLDRSGRGDRLVRVSSSHATGVRMHWDMGCDGTAEVVDAIPLTWSGTPPGPPGPGHLGHLPYYLEIVDLDQPVRAGTTVPLTFTFAEAGTVTVDAMVQTRPRGEISGLRACSPAGSAGSATLRALDAADTAPPERRHSTANSPISITDRPAEP